MGLLDDADRHNQARLEHLNDVAQDGIQVSPGADRMISGLSWLGSVLLVVALVSITVLLVVSLVQAD